MDGSDQALSEGGNCGAVWTVAVLGLTDVRRCSRRRLLFFFFLSETAAQRSGRTNESQRRQEARPPGVVHRAQMAGKDPEHRVRANAPACAPDEAEHVEG